MTGVDPAISLSPAISALLSSYAWSEFVRMSQEKVIFVDKDRSEDVDIS